MESMNKLLILAILAVIIIAILFLIRQQSIIESPKIYNATVADILKNPEKYIGNYVIVSGYLRALTIDKFTENRSEMKYLLQDNSDVIDLIFEKPPGFLTIGKRLVVKAEVILRDSKLFLKVKEYHVHTSSNS